MKKSLILLSFFALISFFACDQKSSTSSDADTTEVTDVVPPVATEVTTVGQNADEAYAVTVLNPDLPSPRKELKGTIDGVNITINYGSPYAKGRQILNNLIPYGRVWRTGANEATTFEVNKAIMVEGKKLPAGKYGLFTLNNEGSTSIIFNSVHDQWGAYEYDESKDVLRVNVTPSVTENPVESMDFKIVGDNVILVWEKVAIPFEVEAA
jgi:hypothetical protein